MNEYSGTPSYIVTFINEYGTILSPIATIIAGIIVWIVYTRQKKESIKRAALSIMIEIEYIEYSINELILILGNQITIDFIFKNWENITRTKQILTTNAWINSYYIVDRLTKKDFESLAEFYSNASSIEIARSEIQKFIFESRKYKNEAIQKAYVDNAIKELLKNIEEYTLDENSLNKIIHYQAIEIKKVTDLGLGDFLPETHALLLSSSLNKYHKAIGTTAYAALNKLAAGNFHIWF